MRRLRISTYRLRTPACDKMATGARRAPEDRQTEGCSHASDNSVAEAVRISQPHYRACAGRGDRFFSPRFASFDRCRVLPNLARRSQSRTCGVARTKTFARRALHVAECG